MRLLRNASADAPGLPFKAAREAMPVIARALVLHDQHGPLAAEGLAAVRNLCVTAESAEDARRLRSMARKWCAHDAVLHAISVHNLSITVQLAGCYAVQALASDKPLQEALGGSGAVSAILEALRGAVQRAFNASGSTGARLLGRKLSKRASQAVQRAVELQEAAMAALHNLVAYVRAVVVVMVVWCNTV